MRSDHPKRRTGKKVAGGMLGVVLLVLYWFLQPVLNERLGLDLPSPWGSANQQESRIETGADAGIEGKAESTQHVSPADQEGGEGSLVEKTGVTGSDTEGSDSTSDLLYGILREIQPERYISPAGLIYGPGSQEGHRLRHLERHVEDLPSRPGSHGVFDGQMVAALRIIDEGYQRAKTEKSGVSKEVDGERTIYTINMGKRIGFVGGRDGNRRKQPMARRLRIVLEGNQVITAFPL